MNKGCRHREKKNRESAPRHRRKQPKLQLVERVVKKYERHKA